MIPFILALNLAFAEPPACPQDRLAPLEAPEDRMAVAWIGRWNTTPRGSVTVVSAMDLRDWLAAQNPRWTGRLLQWVGRRSQDTDPKGRWQVRIYEVDSTELCRPVPSVEQGVMVGGLPVCAKSKARPFRRSDGCGRALDRKTGQLGPEQFVMRVSDVKDRGYCVLPLTRYVDEVTEN